MQTNTHGPEREQAEVDGRDSPVVQGETQDAADFWEKWWKARLARDAADLFPSLPAPLITFRGRSGDIANNDRLLVILMSEFGLKTILCAGSGVSQEPRALAACGFEVTALDISPTALHMAESFELDSRGLSHFCDPKRFRAGGHADFVVGDLLDTTTCPGPFDVVIERRVVQRLAELQRPVALEALSRRLAERGIFVSHCDDDQFPPELGWSVHESGLFHASESWFREFGWTIWDGAPSSTLVGQVAWLIRSGTMKSPRAAGDGTDASGTEQRPGIRIAPGRRVV